MKVPVGRGSDLLKRAATALVYLAAAVASLSLAIRTANVLGQNPAYIGQDLDVVCSSLNALRAGVDPYSVSKHLPHWQLPYPVLPIYLFAPLCAIDPQTYLYTYVFVILGACSAVGLAQLVPANLLDRTLVFAATFLSFDSFRWTLMTGNVALLELPFAVATVYLLVKEHHGWAGVSFGLMASMKILPLVGAVAFLPMPVSLRKRAASVTGAVAAFLTVHVINAVLFSRFTPSYVAHLLNRIPGGTLYEAGGAVNPNTQDMFIGLFRRVGIEHATLPIAALAFLALGIGFWAANARASICSQERKHAPATVFSLILLVSWLFVFRLKPYAFETFVPFLVVAGYGLGRSAGRGAVMVSILVPMLLLTHTLPIRSLYDYSPLIGAWAVVLFLLTVAVESRWGAPPGHAQPGN